MAAQKVTSVEANAFLAATATNKEDFEDFKKLFKESLQEALKGADKETRIRTYEQALRGFLLQLGQEEDEADKIIERLQTTIHKLAELPEQEHVKLPWLLEWGSQHYRFIFLLTILLGALATLLRLIGI